MTDQALCSLPLTWGFLDPGFDSAPPGHCRHLRREPAYGKPLSPAPYNSAFKLIKLETERDSEIILKTEVYLTDIGIKL